MRDETKEAAIAELWRDYGISFQQSTDVVNAIGRESDPKKRAALRKRLRAFDARGLKLMGEMDRLEYSG